jgi:hypothetical protein
MRIAGQQILIDAALCSTGSRNRVEVLPVEVYRSTAEFLISQFMNLELVDTLQSCSSLGSHDLGLGSLGS